MKDAVESLGFLCQINPALKTQDLTVGILYCVRHLLKSANFAKNNIDMSF